MGLLDRIRQRKADAERHRIKRAMRWGDKAETSDSCVDGACVFFGIFSDERDGALGAFVFWLDF